MTPEEAPSAGDIDTLGDKASGQEESAWTRVPRFVDNLRFRVAALLSIALLPIGIIALAQTQRSMDSAQEAFEASLQAQTARIATPEREAIVTAFGLARGLAETLVILRPERETCHDLMERTRDRSEDVSFVGFIGLGAISTCNSSREQFDFSDNTASVRLFADPRPEVTFNPAGEVSRQAVIIVSQPVYDGEEFLGFVAISVPSRPISVQRPELELGGLGVFLTFNQRGEVLTTEGDARKITGQLPANRTLAEMTGSGDFTFQARALDGTYRTFSVVPIVPDRAYALGSWARQSLPGGPPDMLPSAALAFPLLMWLVSLAVALMAVNRLVLRHVRALSSSMKIFAEKRTLPIADSLGAHAPTEFREINQSFDRMARKIVRDEADLENVLFERNVLFREVHHRVKNNLQLMSSIMNMQIRRARSEEAKSALKGVQERVASLAAVHRGLYESPQMSEVRADALLRGLIGQLQVIGIAREGDIEVELDLEPLVLIPDQAAPLALLTTEAVTNALKYIAPDARDRCLLDIRLAPAADGEAGEISLSIANSISPDEPPPDREASGAGLGRRLIDSFVGQLGGRSRTEISADRFRLVVSFLPAPFDTAREG